MIYAIDFDGTLCEDAYPEIGAPRPAVIDLCKVAKKAGEKLILWTCRQGDDLKAAVEWCAAQGVTFDAVNDNLPEMIEKFGNNCRKVNADAYIDDKTVAIFSDLVTIYDLLAHYEGWGSIAHPERGLSP